MGFFVLRHDTAIQRERVFKSWANTADWSARMAPARAGFEAKFLRENGGDPKRAAAARRAYFLEIQRKSVEVRRARKAAHKAADGGAP